MKLFEYIDFLLSDLYVEISLGIGFQIEHYQLVNEVHLI